MAILGRNSQSKAFVNSISQTTQPRNFHGWINTYLPCIKDITAIIKAGWKTCDKINKYNKTK